MCSSLACSSAKSFPDDAFGLGVDFILGLELMIPQTPLALSLDIKPFFEVATTGNAYFGIDPGFGVKVFF